MKNFVSSAALTIALMIPVAVVAYFFFGSSSKVITHYDSTSSQPGKTTGPRLDKDLTKSSGLLAPDALPTPDPFPTLDYERRKIIDASGYNWISQVVTPWPEGTSLEDIALNFKTSMKRAIDSIGEGLADPGITEQNIAIAKFARASFHNFQGNPREVYQDLSDARAIVDKYPDLAKSLRFTVIYFQGVTALRLGENENCIMCRGESSCIIPIAPSAIHKQTNGSRTAIKHFTEYLARFPDDREVKWLLNVCYMTLGQHPTNVPPEYLVSLERFNSKEHSIGKFRDIGQSLGVNRFNQAGGAIMEDFDNDGRLDIVVSSFDPASALGVYMNDGLGKFISWTDQAGVKNQLGGLNCMQTDYNNDGFMDVLIVRGAWLAQNMAMRPTLLRNNGDRTFTDVTVEAKLDQVCNSISAAWADYDNDGWLDLFVSCEKQANRLYRNNRDGTFEERAVAAGLAGQAPFACKGQAWIDYDNDGFQDIYLNHLSDEGSQLFHNNRDGTFSDVSLAMGVRNPLYGFSCWAWDFNNDGYLDIYSSCYDRSVASCVQGLIGEKHDRNKNALYLNENGTHFRDVTEEMGLDQVHVTMGSNFGDFDNDGFLDMYLGTGEPNLGTLVPNRMFKNIRGKTFADITSSSGTGNLQKGHGVACGDWDADGNVDVFIQMGGAVNGDKYHNILFQNPGHANNWVNLKLIGEKTNKAAIGARVKIETTGAHPMTIHREVTSGSSFGGNPLELCVGIGDASEIKSIEVTWPTSGTVKRYDSVSMNKFYRITEATDSLIPIERTKIDLRIPEPSVN